MTEDSHIEIRDLFIAIRPLARVKEGTSMLESMWSSMSSSMQLAQECLEKEEGISIAAQTSHVMEGLERFAQTIDNGNIIVDFESLFFVYCFVFVFLF